MRDSLRSWFSCNTSTALTALAVVLFVATCLTGMFVETLNKPTQVSEQTIKRNTEAIDKNNKNTERKLDKLAGQVESLQTLTTRTANKPSDFAGTWTSNNFKLVIRKDGTGTFAVAGDHYELCFTEAAKCMTDKVKLDRSGNVKLLPVKKVNQMMVRLTAVKKSSKPNTHNVETYVLSKSSDNRMVMLTGQVTGRVVYSGCNTAITTGLPWGCRPPKP